MRNYVQPGDMITVVAPYALASGAGCLVGSLFGVASAITAVGAEAEIKTTGVFDLVAAPAATGAFGAKAYWDNAAKAVTGVAAGNSPIGVFVAEKVANAVVARVRLDGTSV